jgi:hypothetical protein
MLYLTIYSGEIDSSVILVTYFPAWTLRARRRISPDRDEGEAGEISHRSQAGYFRRKKGYHSRQDEVGVSL